ncbi:hypothetical protein JZ751_008186 [Albula glossodonta]|uniref:PP1-binding domain-containing protein n=1 Tax=Albula glossodonta TaxID=121402 RepID=A0A8T2ND05_9TELE|nr:hypothetical protein JZ751_008186 [Albula glossodonta]
MASAEVMNGIAEDGEEWSWDSPTSVAPAYTLPSSPQNKQSLDFSHITPAQLGISTQSFIPSSNGKDKTRVSQLKAKRRSTVGVRGSPETNSLIRYIAQQRLKSPAVTPQPLQASPFYPRGLSSLKQKMASFQNLLEVEEDPKQAEQKETGGGSPVLGKENVGPQGHPLPAGPPSSKKPRVGPLTEKAGEAAQATPPFLDLAPLHSRCHPEQHQVEQTAHVESSADSVRRLCSEQLESSQVDSEKPSPVEITRCQTEEVACGSTGRSPWPRRIDQNAIPLTPTRCTPTKEQWTWTTAAESPCLDPPAHTSACPGATSTQQQKKRVRFGAPLSPEFFDKCLPPSTPLQKGGTPAPAPASGGSQLRSLLKTPQRCGPALPQPDFSSPSLADPSPPVTSLEEEEEGKVTAPVVAEESVGSPEDRDVAPLVRKTLAQRRSPLPKTTPGSPQTPSRLKETEVDTVPDPIPNSTPEPTPEPLIGPTPEQPVGPSPASKQPIGPIPAEPTGPAPAARSRGRKRKQPEENNTAERKRPSRSAAISASGKMKVSIAASLFSLWL